MDRSKWNNMPQCADIAPMMRFFFSIKKHLPKNSTIAYVVVWNFQIFKICTPWEGGYAYHCSVVGVTLLPIVLHFWFLLLFLFSFLLAFLFSSFLSSLFASPASPCFSRHAFLPSASFPCFSLGSHLMYFIERCGMHSLIISTSMPGPSMKSWIPLHKHASSNHWQIIASHAPCFS